MEDQRSPTVLVVDPRDRAAALYRELESSGMFVRAARSRAEALAIVRVARFDVVLVDGELLDTPPIDLARELRAEDHDALLLLIGAPGQAPPARDHDLGALWIERPAAAGDLAVSVRALAGTSSPRSHPPPRPAPRIRH
jgi:DNA-binding response OmpR family regulator